MISTVIEASRSWGATLNRLGWGCLCVLVFSWSFGMELGFIFPNEQGVTFSRSILFFSLVLLLGSALLGSMAITLGSIAAGQRFSLEKRTLLAERIGKLNNPLLIQLYHDATVRFETAAGLRGTLLLTGLAFFTRWFNDGVGKGVSTLPPSFSLASPSWAAMSGFVLALVFEWLLVRSSAEAFQALEIAGKVAENRGTVAVVND